jgi:hypothetical protein
MRKCRAEAMADLSRTHTRNRHVMAAAQAIVGCEHTCRWLEAIRQSPNTVAWEDHRKFPASCSACSDAWLAARDTNLSKVKRLVTVWTRLLVKS